ncbi:hypothetical protein RBH94_06030 [Aestuariibaculum sp. YM273]|uniref:hypothetical protein n=1 Tax=Aestuariibaculum sp. YM273 TaxID=3070659 RepID=UPI0027DCEA88|nr:hypothetical protein [Aestuariibaculum sp. YM273]WMI66719.1 hypothetical protein RBH94_06030 [Aestuariibaculum sp. YM273]
MNQEPKNHFIESFKSSLETIKNKEYLIDNEINQIQLFTSSEGSSSIPWNPGDLNFNNETNSVFDLMEMGGRSYFNSVFNEYLMHGEVQPIYEENEEGEMIPTDEDFLRHDRENAILFADYYQWLKELKNGKNKSHKPKLSPLTHKQKILALHYLGLDLNKYDNVKTAKILSQILGVGEENTRKYLSYVSAGKNSVRTKQNLDKIHQLFENVGVTEISNKIKSDLEK